ASSPPPPAGARTAPPPSPPRRSTAKPAAGSDLRPSTESHRSRAADQEGKQHMATQWEPPAPTRLDPVQPATSARLLVVPVLVGCLVALTLGIYGRLPSPTGVAVGVLASSPRRPP